MPVSGQVPQSPGQLEQVSLPEQAPSPHPDTQSSGQEVGPSVWVQAPSPHTAGQSVGQVEAVSPVSHTLFPHTWEVPPLVRFIGIEVPELAFAVTSSQAT